MFTKQTFNPFETPQVEAPVNEHWAAKRRAADTLRRLTTQLMTTTAAAPVLDAAVENIERQIAALAESPQRFGTVGFGGDGDDDSYVRLSYELNSLIGQSNPVAPAFKVWLDGDRAHAEVSMGWQYEGPPNSVHGGFVAALFDQFLGVAQKMTRQPGFTGTLSVRYLSPTPLATDLRLLGWVEKVEGRKSFLVGEMWAGDTLTARCEGIFISVSRDKVEQLKRREIGGNFSSE